MSNYISQQSHGTQKVTGEISQIDTWIKSEIGTIPPKSRKLVTTHDALGYYVKAYGIPVEQALAGISTEEAPTAALLKRIGERYSKNWCTNDFCGNNN